MFAHFSGGYFSILGYEVDRESGTMISSTKGLLKTNLAQLTSSDKVGKVVKVHIPGRECLTKSVRLIWMISLGWLGQFSSILGLCCLKERH